ncbi:MAG: glycosyltransferase family 2 protein [Flavobacteriales bacterium]|nr:glycosyltransferase family 2 protein [Flavobacteriales bacterium]
MPPPKISVIIPIYNEEENILHLHDRIHAVLKSITDSFQLVFVNDGSRDNSLHIIKSLAQENAQVRFIDLSRNFGHQVAVSAGLDHAHGDAVVIIDADLQDPPEVIVQLYKKLMEGNDVVYAKRKSRSGESWLKKITAKIFYRILSRLTSFNIPVDTGDFRIMSRRIVAVLRNMPEQQKYLRGQIAWAGFRQTYVEYNREKRNAGKTGYTYRKMIRFALDGVTSFSNFPLRFATIAGFVVSGIAFIIMLYTLYSRFIIKDYVPGWASLILSVLFIGGIQLIGIGIIGEYISRINANVRNRPLYLINETNMDKTIDANETAL